MPDLPDETRSALAAALQQWPQNPQVAAEGLRTLAESGDPTARLVLAWMLASTGRAVEGLPYARQAIADGAISLGILYGANLLNDPSHRAEGIRLMREARDAGWPIDPLGYMPTVAQQGDLDAALELVDFARTAQPPGARKAWEDLLEEMRGSLGEVSRAAQVVGERSNEAQRGIAAAEAAVEADRERVTKIVGDVEQLVHRAASETLAKEYARQAEAEDRRARRYTWASLLAGVLAVAFAVVVAAVVLAGNHNVGSVFAKGALTLPLVAFAAYLGGLGRSHRRMAWHWRHVELQIRTADPFIAPLDEALRKSVTAALALRFFPGQAQDPQHAESGGAEGLGQLLEQITPRPRRDESAAKE